MTGWLPAAPLLIAFVAASGLLAVTPGPGVLYIVTRTLAQGRRAGLASVAGVALGNFGNALGASLGLAALFAVSAWAFTAVQLSGAAYLVWLGIKALRAWPAAAAAPAVDAVDSGRIFRDGFVVALLNPKTALFFAAFLPQFMNSGEPPVPQSVALGTLFVLIAATTDSAYALAAGSVAPWLARWQRRSRTPGRGVAWLTAATFIGLGVFTAATGSRVPVK